MFLIPFCYKKLDGLYPIHVFYIFLTRGVHFLNLDSSEIDSFCYENGLYYAKKYMNGDYCYLDINTTKTKLDEFYSYFENSEAECWRKFIIVGDYSEDILHVNSTNPEFIQPILKSIFRFKANHV